MNTKELIQHFDNSVEAAAAALGVSRNAIYMWGNEIPELRQFQIEVITGGALRVDDRYFKRAA